MGCTSSKPFGEVKHISERSSKHSTSNATNKTTSPPTKPASTEGPSNKANQNRPSLSLMPFKLKSRKSKKEKEDETDANAPPWVTKKHGVFVPDEKNVSGGYVVSRDVYFETGNGEGPKTPPAES